MADLYYVHDPMCSWCYGFKHTLEALVNALPSDIQLTYLLGGLAPDSDQPMPLELQKTIKSTWQRIESTIPGTIFNYNFWNSCQPRRSTYPACRSIIAARKQGDKFNLLMTAAIQKAYYQYANNPSDDETLIGLASDLGLNTELFINDLNSQSTNNILLDEISLAREMEVDSFPGLSLVSDGLIRHIPVDYSNYKSMLDLIDNMDNWFS